MKLDQMTVSELIEAITQQKKIVKKTITKKQIEQQEKIDLLERDRLSKSIFSLVHKHLLKNQSILLSDGPFILLSTRRKIMTYTIVNPDGMQPMENTKENEFSVLSLLSCGIHDSDHILDDNPVFSQLFSTGHHEIINIVSEDLNHIVSNLRKLS